MKFTLRKTIIAVIAAALCLFAAGTLTACSESGGTVDQNTVILTEDDYAALKDDWFPILSTGMSGEVAKKHVEYPLVNKIYYCVYTGIGSAGISGQLDPHGKVQITLDGKADGVEIIERTGNLNFFGDTFGSAFTPNEEATALEVEECFSGAEFAMNNGVTGFKFTVAVKFILTRAGKLCVNAECTWKDKFNELPQLETYARYERHVEVDGPYLSAALAIEVGDDGEIAASGFPEMHAGAAYLISAKFSYSVAADQSEPTAFYAVLSTDAAEATLYLASSGDYESSKNNGVTTVKIKFSLPQSSAEKTEAKILIRVKPAKAGTHYLNFSLYGEATSFTESATKSIEFTVS